MNFLEGLREYIRPIVVAALIFVLLFGAAVAGLLEAFMPGYGVRFTVGVAGWFKAIPAAYYQLAGVGTVAYTAAREYGKAQSERARVEAVKAHAAVIQGRPADPDAWERHGGIRPEDPKGGV